MAKSTLSKLILTLTLAAFVPVADALTEQVSCPDAEVVRKHANDLDQGVRYENNHYTLIASRAVIYNNHYWLLEAFAVAPNYREALKIARETTSEVTSSRNPYVDEYKSCQYLPSGAVLTDEGLVPEISQ